MFRKLIVASRFGLSLLLFFGGSVVSQDAAAEFAGDSTPSACPATTEEENIAIASVWHEEAINRRNPDALQDVIDPQVIHHAAGGYPEEMTVDGVSAMMNDVLSAFPDLHYSFDFWVVEDDMVVERYPATGTQRG